MGHEGSIIPSSVMDELAPYGQTFSIPLWVVNALGKTFEPLGLYAYLASAAAGEDEETMRVTVSKYWADGLFGGFLGHLMEPLLNIGAITKFATYPSGKVRLQIELYPPDVREEMNEYRRPNGVLVLGLGNR